MFTFKKHIPVGKYKSFETNYSDIKLKEKKVGHISETRFGGYTIQLAIKKEITKQDPSPFKNISFKKKFQSEAEARLMLNTNFKEIIKKFDLFQFKKE